MRIFLIILILIPFCCLSQNKVYYLNAIIESLNGTNTSSPFWLTHNQAGRYQDSTNSNQVLRLENEFHYTTQLLQHNLEFTSGADFLISHSPLSNLAYFNQLYFKTEYRGWYINGGLYEEEPNYNGLSSTNGNIDRSNNAKPYPKIRLATQDFIGIPLLKQKPLLFKAEYDEGILNDQRNTIDTRFHHKSLAVKYISKNKLSIALGLNHFVMWGGTSPSLGKLPDSFKDYITYITGSTGGEHFPQTDQLNVAGNQFGSYKLNINYNLKNANIELYINHPFEDHSGMEFDNDIDNLYGLSIKLKKQEQLINHINLEYLHTMHQSGHIHKIGFMRGRDNYYNHGVYSSGYTYNNRTMAAPLFTLAGNGLGIANNRLKMLHMGISGEIKSSLLWRALFTHTLNYGTYAKPYESTKSQFYSLINIEYDWSRVPLKIGFTLAYDKGELLGNNFGGKISISKVIL